MPNGEKKTVDMLLVWKECRDALLQLEKRAKDKRLTAMRAAGGL